MCPRSQANTVPATDLLVFLGPEPTRYQPLTFCHDPDPTRSRLYPRVDANARAPITTTVISAVMLVSDHTSVGSNSVKPAQTYDTYIIITWYCSHKSVVYSCRFCARVRDDRLPLPSAHEQSLRAPVSALRLQVENRGPPQATHQG